MKKLIWISILIGALGLVRIVHASSISLDLMPDTTTVTVGDMLNVDVIISGLIAGGPPSVGTYDLDVSFDPGILNPVDVDFGLFLGDPFFFEVLTDFDFSIPGIVDFAAVSLLPSADLDALQSSSFTLATLSFSAIGDGTSQFQFVGDVRVDDTFGNKFQIPEPHTSLLLLLGIFTICLRQLKKSRHWTDRFKSMVFLS